MVSQNWKGKISNPAQLGGIETSVLDNGASKGTRVAWINTGAGLRYKVVIDRAMDIADAFYNQHNLVWLSQLGLTSPQPFSNRGADWLKTFGGGLVTTCGLTHVGGPEQDEFGERGLHGEISNLPAEIVSVIQPDPVAGKMEMSITGKIRQSQPLGVQLELTRTISGVLGEPIIRVHDEVLNRGNTPAPHMILYHCNLGWPLVDEGSEIIWKGSWEPRDEASKTIFNTDHNFRQCVAPLPGHSGTGEAAAFINVEADASGISTCGLYNPQIELALALRFQKKQLPWLTNWQHWGEGEYVTGLEPGSHPPIGQQKAREQKSLIFLPPGESKTYDLEFEVLSTKIKIKDSSIFKIL